MKNFFYVSMVVAGIFSACSSNDKPQEAVVVEQNILPLREVKDINVFIEQIKADSIWSNLISKKASESGKSFDEMLAIDAQFLQDEDANIVKIENEIIQNEEWLNSVKQKAETQGLDINKAIRSDAEFMYNERKKTPQ